LINRRRFLSNGAGVATTLALPFSASARQHSQNSTFNIAVIGAGLFGSAAAKYLSSSDEDIALIGPEEPDSRSNHQGVFASHYDESRLVRGIDPDLIWATLAKRSINQYRKIETASNINFYRDVGYMMVTPGGLGEDWFNLPAMREVAADLNVKIENLNQTDLTDRFPYLDFTAGSSAVLQSEDAGYINPRLLVAAQQSIGMNQGVTAIREVATRLIRKDGHIEIALGSGDKIRANRVLIATGAYTNAANLLPKKLDLKIRAAMIMESEVQPSEKAIYPTTLYAKTDGKEDFWGLLMPPVRYADGRTVVKTMDGYYGPRPLQGYAELGDWNRGNGHEDHHEVLRRALREVYPTLKVLRTLFKPCLITDTESHYPYIDMLDERIGLAVGGNGKSAKSSNEIGRIAAGMINSQMWSSSLPHNPFTVQFA